MKQRILTLGLILVSTGLHAEPTPAATSAFNNYTAVVETRLAHQHSTQATFVAPIHNGFDPGDARLRAGEFVVERLHEPSAPTAFDGSLLHHWRGTVFLPGATAANFERLLRDIDAYPRNFAPQVTQARLVASSGDRQQTFLRVRQHHVITITMDTDYDVAYAHLDPRHGYSLSHSTRIAEIDAAGTPAEHALSPQDDHGFLYRLNTYWTFEERDGGLYLQIEAVSLTRAVPRGLGWVIRPYIDIIPRESLDFTLHSAATALQKGTLNSKL